MEGRRRPGLITMGVSFAYVALALLVIQPHYTDGAFIHAVAFVLGFSTVFVLLGASVALLGHVLNSYLPLLVKVGGLLLILFGLQTSGFLGWMAERLRQHRW